MIIGQKMPLRICINACLFGLIIDANNQHFNQVEVIASNMKTYMYHNNIYVTKIHEMSLRR